LDINAINSAAIEAEDLTVDQKFERELPKAGIAFLRLLSYVELGRFESKNPTHKPALKTILTFELSHPKHQIDIDGKKVNQTIQVRVNKGTTSKSGFRKLFKVMNAACGGTHKGFASMIGQPMLGEIYHNEVGEGDKKQTYANLDLDGAWSMKRPVKIDEISEEETSIAIPELQGTPSLFFWENPSLSDEQVKETWDSIFIEGEREVEDEKTKEKVLKSKNWIQELIQTNIEWEGSRTQALTQEHINIDELEDEPDLSHLSENATGEPELPSLDD